MWDLRVCRGCLVTEKEGILEPINKMLKMGYQALTGLEMKDGDGYPTYFCLECCVHIKKAWAFRRKSRRAFFVMREIMIIRNEVTIKDIQTINREKTHLISSCSYWNLKSNIIFNIDNTEDDGGMVQYTPVIDNTVCHNIEVIPEITQNIEEEDIEPAMDDAIDNIEDADDKDTNNYDNIPKEIDLEDVFKDLKEESSSESEIEELAVEKVQKNVEKKTFQCYPNTYDGQVNKVTKALCNTNIVVLSDVDQKSMQVIRSKMHPFLTAKFKCALCLLVFKDVVALMKHVQDHRLNHGGLVCGVCKNTFPTEERLKVHEAQNHMYEYTCKICSHIMYTLADVIKHNECKHPEVFKSKSMKMNSLLAHFKFISLTPEQMKAQRNNVLVCSKCNSYFRNRYEFSEHVSNHKGTRYYCEICLKYNNSKGILQDHMVKFHLYNYKCIQCSEVISTRSKARMHINNGLCNKQDSVHCNYCFVPIVSESHLKTHYWFKHYTQVYVFECNLCGHSYTTLESLYRHQITKHKHISPMDPKLGSPEHACKICNYQFYSRRAYEKHAVRANHPEIDSTNVCRPCRRIFDSEEECSKHQCVRHKRLEYPRQCDYCDQILNNETEQQSHHKKLHPHLTIKSSQRLNLCQICGALLPLRRLHKHMKKHSGDLLNKYDCNRCDPWTSWPNVYDYIDHVLKIHTKNPYHCTVCNDTFKFRSACRDHILKIHAPALLYVCGHCKEQFSHRDFLIDHCKMYHNFNMKKVKPQRLRKNMYVYPHMRIDVSLIEPEVLEVIKVDLYDYVHKKYDELDDPSSYLITDKFHQYFDHPKPVRKRKAKSAIDNINKKPKRSKNDESIITTRTVVFNKNKKGEKENGRNGHVSQDLKVNETVAATEFLVERESVKIEGSEYGNLYDNNGEDSNKDEFKVKVNDEEVYDNSEQSEVVTSELENGEMIPKGEFDETSEEVIEGTIEQELEILDINGENYVMLNDVLYKVETQEA